MDARRSRRHALRQLGALAVVPLAAGCGFQLRRPPRLNFATVQLVGFPQRSANRSRGCGP